MLATDARGRRMASSLRIVVALGEPHNFMQVGTLVAPHASLDERLTDVFRSIFGPEVDVLADEDSPQTIGGWDSVSHIHLLTALETEFDVAFEPGEFAELVTVGAIRRRVAAAAGNGGS